MFQPGELLVYGTTGVCRVEEITTPDLTRADRGRRLGMVDERYMKQAERLLHGELSAALGIPLEEVQPYIARRVQEASTSQM